MLGSLTWQHTSSRFQQFYQLTKPRVVSLIVFTAVIGMFLATPGMVPLQILVFGTVGIALVAGAAAAINCLVEQNIDAIMTRTRWRPLPSGRITSGETLAFAAVTGGTGLALLYCLVLAQLRVRDAALLGLVFGLSVFLGGVSWVYVSLSVFGGMPMPLAALATLAFCSVLALFPSLALVAFALWRWSDRVWDRDADRQLLTPEEVARAGQSHPPSKPARRNPATTYGHWRTRFQIRPVR